jgi:hypothetical protein
MERVSFNYKGQKIVLEAREMKGLNKLIGLIFYRDILLFNFGDNSNVKIHSLFCPRFLAVWLDKENEVVDLKIVNSWKLSVSSVKTFSKLVEIPINEEYGNVVEKLVPKG